MFGSILVPLDGSPLAERALAYAALLARRSGARLILVRGVPDAVEADVDEIAADAQVVAEAEVYLTGLADQLEEQQISTESVVAGVGGHLTADEVATWIVEECRRRQVGLVVLSTHGHSGLGRRVYGSVAEAVLVRTTLPVFLVRAWAAEEPVAIDDHPRLLVPLDGSAFAEQALPLATALADALVGEVVVVYAVPRPELVFGPDQLVAGFLDDEQRRLESEARDYLGALAARLAAQGRRVQTEVRVGDPAAVIDATGRELGVAVIVMATHGRSGLLRLVFGSVAAAVVRQATVPILLIRPQGREGAAARDSA